MYNCPDCKQPLQQVTMPDGRTKGYECHTPSCLVIKCHPRINGTYHNISREAVARDEPLTWLTYEDITHNPKILEMNE